MGSKGLHTGRVIGYSRVPFPAARIMPFIATFLPSNLFYISSFVRSSCIAYRGTNDNNNFKRQPFPSISSIQIASINFVFYILKILMIAICNNKIRFCLEFLQALNNGAVAEYFVL